MEQKMQLTIRNEKNEVCINLWLNDDEQCGESIFDVVTDFYKDKESYLILIGTTEIYEKTSTTYIFSKEFMQNKFIQIHN